MTVRDVDMLHVGRLRRSGGKPVAPTCSGIGGQFLPVLGASCSDTVAPSRRRTRCYQTTGFVRWLFNSQTSAQQHVVMAILIVSINTLLHAFYNMQETLLQGVKLSLYFNIINPWHTSRLFISDYYWYIFPKYLIKYLSHTIHFIINIFN